MVGRPLRYKVPSINECELALSAISTASIKSTRNIPFSMYVILRDIQDGRVVLLIAIITTLGFSMLGFSKFLG